VQAVEGCEFVSVDDIGLPRFLCLEFGKKRVVVIGSEDRTSPIQNVPREDGVTIVQGAVRGARLERGAGRSREQGEVPSERFWRW
jgi:hypothetical protein